MPLALIGVDQAERIRVHRLPRRIPARATFTRSVPSRSIVHIHDGVMFETSRSTAIRSPDGENADPAPEVRWVHGRLGLRREVAEDHGPPGARDVSAPWHQGPTIGRHVQRQEVREVRATRLDVIPVSGATAMRSGE